MDGYHVVLVCLEGAGAVLQLVALAFEGLLLHLWFRDSGRCRLYVHEDVGT